MAGACIPEGLRSDPGQSLLAIAEVCCDAGHGCHVSYLFRYASL
jgi:hypothetical protein